MFDFENNYSEWRENKLAHTVSQAALEPLLIANPSSLSDAELALFQQHCEHNNFALYRFSDPSIIEKSVIATMARQFNMHELDQNLCADNDSISSLEVMDLGRAQGYIPYTSKALNWHTDGYYNPLSQHIRSFLLHCVRNAMQGGENMLINHDLIYIQLYDTAPSLITALCQPDALTIPANIENGVEVRRAQSGPVFYRDPLTNTLQMRYTARSRSIQWKQDKDLRRAVAMIEELLADSAYVLHYTLQPGEGLVCNNILHGRSAFTNGNIPQQHRLMYRVRSYNRLFSQ